jgi:hypothetical protein
MENKELDHIIEKSFRTKPDFHLPADFAQKVTLSVVRREQLKNDLYEYLYLTGVLLSLLSVVGGLYYYLDKELVARVLSFASGNVIQVVLTVFILNFIFFTDRVLLRLLFRSLPLPPPKEG